MTRDFAAHNAVLLATQAALVGLTGAGIRAWLQRYAAARWALVTWFLAEAWTLLFYVTDTIPATVPIAVALILREVLRAGRAQPDTVGGEVAHGARP